MSDIAEPGRASRSTSTGTTWPSPSRASWSPGSSTPRPTAAYRRSRSPEARSPTRSIASWPGSPTRARPAATSTGPRSSSGGATSGSSSPRPPTATSARPARCSSTRSTSTRRRSTRCRPRSRRRRPRRAPRRTARSCGTHGAGAFEIVMLGLGPDAHVASLVPRLPAARRRRHRAVAVHDSPKPPPDRITLTLPCLNRARSVWFVVSRRGQGRRGRPGARRGHRRARRARAGSPGRTRRSGSWTGLLPRGSESHETQRSASARERRGMGAGERSGCAGARAPRDRPRATMDGEAREASERPSWAEVEAHAGIRR